MRIYVSELPKKCEDCPFYKLDTYVDVCGYQTNSHECVLDGSMLTNSCPLQSLADHTKQVRKEVCEQITEELLDVSHQYWKTFLRNGVQYMTSDDLYEFLKEINNKND